MELRAGRCGGWWPALLSTGISAVMLVWWIDRRIYGWIDTAIRDWMDSQGQ